MFDTLWRTLGSSTHGSDKDASSLATGASGRTHPANDASSTCSDDDSLAHQLLTQFPAYGTNSPPSVVGLEGLDLDVGVGVGVGPQQQHGHGGGGRGDDGDGGSVHSSRRRQQHSRNRGDGDDGSSIGIGGGGSSVAGGGGSIADISTLHLLDDSDSVVSILSSRTGGGSVAGQSRGAAGAGGSVAHASTRSGAASGTRRRGGGGGGSAGAASAGEAPAGGGGGGAAGAGADGANSPGPWDADDELDLWKLRTSSSPPSASAPTASAAATSAGKSTQTKVGTGGKEQQRAAGRGSAQAPTADEDYPTDDDEDDGSDWDGYYRRSWGSRPRTRRDWSALVGGVTGASSTGADPAGAAAKGADAGSGSGSGLGLGAYGMTATAAVRLRRGGQRRRHEHDGGEGDGGEMATGGEAAATMGGAAAAGTAIGGGRSALPVSSSPPRRSLTFPVPSSAGGVVPLASSSEHATAPILGQNHQIQMQAKQQQVGDPSLFPSRMILYSSSSSEEEEDDDDAGGDPTKTRQHWMPDRLCRHCYACEVPFTVFRRRHHCRLCGQVFCSACSAYFVEVGSGEIGGEQQQRVGDAGSGGGEAPSIQAPDDASSKTGQVGGNAGGTSPPTATAGAAQYAQQQPNAVTAATAPRTMRACKMCYDQVSASGGTIRIGDGRDGSADVDVELQMAHQQQLQLQQQPSTSPTNASLSQVPQGGNRPQQQQPNAPSLMLPRVDAMGAGTNEHLLLTDVPTTSPSIADQMAGMESDGITDQQGGAFSALSQTRKKLDEERRQREEEERDSADMAKAALAARAASEYKASEELEGEDELLGSKRLLLRRGKRLVRAASGIGGHANSKGARIKRELSARMSSSSLGMHTDGAENDDGDDGERAVLAELGHDSCALPPTSQVLAEAAMASAAADGDGDGLGREVSASGHDRMTTARTDDDSPKAIVAAANRRLGLTAADHLERMGRELLLSDAPLLGLDDEVDEGGEAGKLLKRWVDTLMLHATRCCATVEPNLKKGDLLDIRPYCKVKVIAGGSVTDCAYMSGVVFHKNVSHKSMAKEISNPRIMLLSGGIEYTRTENRIASLDTLLEQEEKYMEILVTKIIKLKPDVLIVGRSVSRKAQELLLRANVALIQHVKSTLMGRIARQTGATILSSTDHVMNQFGTSVLGKCKRFRLVTFRDNETWLDHQKVSLGNGLKGKAATDATAGDDRGSKQYAKDPAVKDDSSEGHLGRHSIEDLLARKDLPNHRRQAVLAANQLGEAVLDGGDAVKCGLSKRGVAFTYVMIEGCPKHLGCTVVLRGASRPALKQVKRIFKFLVNVAYNVKLETSYLRERCAMLPPEYVIPPKPTCSSSLCVDYGSPPLGRKVRPWNGGKNDASQRSLSGKITALDHQSILITSVWMTGKNQCCPAEVKGICYYSMQDVSLGQFLRDSCFNLSLKCQNPSCKKSVLDHSLSFIHNDSLINITVEHMDEPLPAAPGQGSDPSKSNDGGDKSSGNKPKDSPIATWSYCVNCHRVVTPLVYISEDTWKFSFGKFLETFFYNRTACLNAPDHGCSCQMQTSSTLYFGCGQLAARFTYEKIRPFGVFVRKVLPFDEPFHRNDALRQLELISVTSSQLFVRFDKHIERISRDARQLFGSAANKPEHLQTVVSELNAIGSEVDHAAKTLQEKIASVTNKFHDNQKSDSGADKIVASKADDKPNIVANETLFRFPWHSRRYLFMLTSAWNERLSAVGQTLSAMKKLAASSQSIGGSSRDLGMGPNVDGAYDEVMSAMKHLKQLQDMYSHYNVGDINVQVTRGIESHPEHHRSMERRRANDMEYHDEQDDVGVEYDDEFNGDYTGAVQQQSEPEFPADNIDADVLASRRRMQNTQESSSRPRRRSVQSDSGRDAPSSRVKKSLGTRRQQPDSFDAQQDAQHRRRSDRYQRQSSAPPQFDNPDAQNKSKTVTAGGAVKSALTRFFNRGNKELDAWKVDLGILIEGRPRLEPGVGGLVIPIFDDQPSTIIAHSLSSVDYDNQFKYFAKSGVSADAAGQSGDAIEDFFAGPGGLESAAQSGKAEKPSLRRGANSSKPSPSHTLPTSGPELRKDIERRMLLRNKSHIKHTFRDFDQKGQQSCKFVCTHFWASQFHAVRQAFLSSSSSPSGKESSSGGEGPSANRSSPFDVESSYIRSLSAAYSWAVSGGKSGASFSRTDDGRFIVKCISRTELQMFLDCAPAYFEYLSKAFFHGLPTVLCKIVGVYQIGYHNRVTGKRTMEQVAVMQNIFHGRKISKVFDLKGSLRGRFTQQLVEKDKEDRSAQETQPPEVKSARAKKYSSSRRSTDELSDSDSSMEDADIDVDDESFASGVDLSERELRSSHSLEARERKKPPSEIHDDDFDSRGNIDKEPSIPTLLDGDFLEFTGGRPLPLSDRAKAVFHMSILNDTLFLSIINVLDYSILVGVDEEKMELVVGIIDFMRQYDILKQMERVGKSLPMVVGSEAPTIIQPPLYKSRFTNAMERYFMTVPSKWTTI